MSWGQCFNASNNIHFDFPPIMADGRVYSSWTPDAVVNNRIKKEENITLDSLYLFFDIFE